MRYLLDTHALFWWLTANKNLSHAARKIIDDGTNLRFVSPVSAFEIANKSRIGKLDAAEIVNAFDNILAAGSFHSLPVTVAHANLAGSMPGTHRDPFDRLLAAQCKLENLKLLTVDPAFGEFGIDIVW